MASANWLKATTQKAGAMKRHLGQKERENGNHSNTNINTFLSKQNYSIGCSDYPEALERMKARTKEVDAIQPPKRIRKDRVTCCFIELPCPDRITQVGFSDLFFQKAFKVMQDFFGTENVHGGFIHKDERHEYIDKDGKRKMSLEHMHTLISAYTKEKGINGKAFETKGRLRAFNKALDDMCIREFGISLNTGETPERKSVERLKEETALRREADKLKDEIAESDYRYGLYQKEEIKITERIEALQSELSEAEEKIAIAKKSEKLIEQAKNIEKKIAESSERYEKMTKTLSDKELEEIDITPKRFTGGFKGLSGQQAQELVNTAVMLKKENKKLTNENKKLKEEKNRLEKEKKSAVSNLERIKNERQVMFSREKLEQMEREQKRKKYIEQIEIERDALKNYMSQLKFNDGSTAFEHFEKEQTQLCQRKNKSFER